MTITSTGTSTTDRPARYAKQLISHMSRRSSGEWDAESATGWIQFTAGRAEFSCLDAPALTATPATTTTTQETPASQDLPKTEDSPCKLVISLTSEDEETATLLEDVLERHLVKFGLKDGLTMDWVRA